MTLKTDGSIYSTYKTTHSDYASQTFQCAEETVAQLLAHETTSEHPGMLLGKVQSGKTRTFMTALALAFDNEFEVAIVLTKNSKVLLDQTRRRLDSEFKHFVSDGELCIYDIMSAPETFSRFELSNKLIFLVKKQADNLNRLLKLITKTCPGLANRHTLIIDDEADNASVGYSKRAGLVEANKVANQISNLRVELKKVSYLQVTATPYSLYLQPDEVLVSNAPVFSPIRPKFTKLVPVPDDYVGGDTYFGEQARSSMLTVESLIHVRVPDDELGILKNQDRRKFKIEDVLTSSAVESLRSAIVSFLVGGSIQRIRGLETGKKNKTLKYSFLIHTEAGKNAHSWQDLILNRMRESLEAEAKETSTLFSDLVLMAYNDLSQSIRLLGLTAPPFSDVLQAATTALIEEHLTITKVNSDEEVISQLDSSGQLRLRSPLSVFVGGQALDRGVTLDNLIGFFYGRNPKTFQQDTVLQHSRMFGYRRADLAVTRFYTTNTIRAAMFEMEEFDSSLRNAIQNGHSDGVQFIRQSDSGGVIPCSPNKILVSRTLTLRPFRRFLPIGFQTGNKSRIQKRILEIDEIVGQHVGFNEKSPTLVDYSLVLDLLSRIQTTLEYEDKDDVEPFDWDSTKFIVRYLSRLNSGAMSGKVWLWAANGRDAARLASEGSHAKFIEAPDSDKTEGRLAKEFAIDNPILFLLRQDGRAEKGWKGTPFYWPVIRAQFNTKTAIYASDAID
jgi:hypothetical protein